MAANNLYMPFHVGDYMADAGHLNTLETGAYMLLIMAYWHKGEGLPANERVLRGFCKMTQEEWERVREAVLPFFQERDGQLYHKRIEQELERAREKSSKAKANAERMLNKRRANAERTLSERSANQEQEQEQVQDQSLGTSVPNEPRAEEADFRALISNVYAKHGHLPPETGTAVTWLKHGRDPQICLAVIDDVLARKGKKLPLSYFEGPIADAHVPPPAGVARSPPRPKAGGNGWSELFRKSHGIGEFADERGN